MISVSGLSKTYRVPIKGEGLAGSFRSLWNRQYRDVEAVKEISFAIQGGERVGFLGPNGAGKTTTLKMLSGLLFPTAGTVSVGGFRPQDRAVAFLGGITLVMGQKQQLLWDLPPQESFALNRAMYGVPQAEYRRTLDQLVAMLRIEPILQKPVRNLSLGERMKCELVAALLHRPRVLFLDEPTIGLDVEMQGQVRRFIQEYNRDTGATVILTSHYMQDIAALTPRLLVIDKGSLRYDGGLAALAERVAPERRIVVKGGPAELSQLGFVVVGGDHVATVTPEQTNQRLAAVLGRWPMVEIAVESPPLEEVMARYFKEGTT
ncbi:MAG: ATP-binding cassette domain-containing protein [Myxococcales bacterium]|nr:ATP-binding cassette domain-containing protein [Myxococcales bacterium]